MSRSEKMRYIRNQPASFPIMSEYYTDLLKNTVAEEDSDILSFISELLNHHHDIRYKLIARYIPLHTSEMIHLLDSFIEEQKFGQHIISESGEYIVEGLTNALLARGKHLLKEKRYHEAAATAFAILIAIERDMCNVYDEGFTYQCIIESAFIFLKTLAEQEYDIETSIALICTANQFFEDRNESVRFYDDEWKEVILSLGKCNDDLE